MSIKYRPLALNTLIRGQDWFRDQIVERSFFLHLLLITEKLFLYITNSFILHITRTTNIWPNLILLTKTLKINFNLYKLYKQIIMATTNEKYNISRI